MLGDAFLLPRFSAKVTKSDGCWLWTGCTNARGYGQFHLNGRTVKPHRIAASFAVGRDLLPGELACHRCDNPRCIRPDHIFIGTHAENSSDMKSKGRQPRVRGESSGAAKLTRYEAAWVKFMHAHGHGASALARLFGVRESTVRYIANGRTWPELGQVYEEVTK